MAKHIVKCKICGVAFDTNVVQAVKCGSRRYAHYSCFPEGELVPLGPEADPELQKLKDYINKLYGKNARWQLINKQIKEYKEKNEYSYSGMLKSLIYFYEIKNNSIEKSNFSVGIIPYVYQDAYNYYYNLFMAQEANKNKTLFTQVKELFISPPKIRGMKQQLFNLEKWEE